jgi:hypothetical protein
MSFDGVRYRALTGNSRGGLSIAAMGEGIDEYDWQFASNDGSHNSMFFKKSLRIAFGSLLNRS